MSAKTSRSARLDALEQRLGHVFRDRELLERALVHSSASAETSGLAHNQSLEFLGDAVLDLAISELLWRTDATSDEGTLTRSRAALVRTGRLADAARQLELGPLLVLGRGEERSGGRTKEKILADAAEAVLGAVFLDAGYASTRKVIRRLYGADFRSGVFDAGDRKTSLQERLHAAGYPAPRYCVVEVQGPAHQPKFEVAVTVNGAVWGTGRAGTRKAAEQKAAAQALEALEETSSDA